ncbi:single-stranded-DNA-specific exonuclease RecJ [bacterium]|nr:single-stranded-DNA-specific exonuclease RecJ [bacterium]
MKWVLRRSAPSLQVELLAKELSTRHPFPHSLSNILIQREIDSLKKAKDFFVPEKNELHDPFLMKDMDLAVMRLLKAHESGEKVWVYGDYDVDGTTSVTLFCLFLESWGFEFDYHIPDRYTEGYGISYKGITTGLAQGATLMVSLDCGIKALEKVKFANLKGMDVIICDHHHPGESLPEAIAILDPKRPDCEYPFKELTGCGIGLKLAMAVNRKLIEKGARGAPDDFDPLAEYADLVALSIASDIVPVVGENRIIAHLGLEKIKTQPLKGIKSIMDLSENQRVWDIGDLVFFIGPHINAAGRLGHAREAVEVLIGHQGLDAEALHDQNEERKNIERVITDEALNLIQQDVTFDKKNTTVLYQPEWHKGVIGIVASRLIETHFRPTIILTRSEGKLVGSARSVPGFDLYAAMEKCAAHMVQFGGHKYAAGLTMEEEAFEDFTNAFEKVVSDTITPEQKIPVLYIDQMLDFHEINARYIRLMNRLGPFGPQNRTPVFVATNVEVIDAVVLKEKHLRLTLRKGTQVFSSIGFNLAEKWKEINNLFLDVAFQPDFNTWKDKTTIHLKLKDIRFPHNDLSSN